MGYEGGGSVKRPSPMAPMGERVNNENAGHFKTKKLYFIIIAENSWIQRIEPVREPAL